MTIEQPGMVVVHASFRVDPAFDDEYVSRARENTDRCLGHEGCLKYGYSRDLFDPTVTYAYQEWTSEEMLAQHAANPDHVGRTRDIERFLAEGRMSRSRVRFYTASKVVDPLQ